MKPAVNLFWFRRDLRLHDNAGLYHALRGKNPVVPVFIFDRDILDELGEATGMRADRRIEFIYRALEQMQEKLHRLGSTLDARYGFVEDIFAQLLKDYYVEKVFTNHDYEPYAVKRDAAVEKLVKKAGISLYTYKDQVITEKGEVLKDDGKLYTVFTPYARKWRSVVNPSHVRSHPTEKYSRNFYQQSSIPLPSLSLMRFRATGEDFPSDTWNKDVIRYYHEQRNIPAEPGVTRLSVHLRFGTISIRDLAREAGALNNTFLNELIWRDFYQMILWHFPQVVYQAFKPGYDKIQWRNNEKEFEAWCKGRTGYPIVDAGMRELNETGYMHNRVRMITASFLVKHLLIDWRWGEAYFAKQLLDFDLAANNGGWQWAAGSGCDAAPYFRIFNPTLQTKKFDPDFRYIRKWAPEWQELSYPPPIVEHEAARKRCLEVYHRALKK